MRGQWRGQGIHRFDDLCGANHRPRASGCGESGGLCRCGGLRAARGRAPSERWQERSERPLEHRLRRLGRRGHDRQRPVRASTGGDQWNCMSGAAAGASVGRTVQRRRERASRETVSSSMAAPAAGGLELRRVRLGRQLARSAGALGSAASLRHRRGRAQASSPVRARVVDAGTMLAGAGSTGAEMRLQHVSARHRLQAPGRVQGRAGAGSRLRAQAATRAPRLGAGDAGSSVDGSQKPQSRSRRGAVDGGCRHPRGARPAPP